MILGPIYKKDVLLMNRSIALPLFLTAMNAVFSILVIINLYSVSMSSAETGEIPYDRFLGVYKLIGAVELILILLGGPAMTSSSITSERERRTLGILLTTQLTPSDIILGKLLSVFTTIMLLLGSSVPILMTVFIYGGVTLEQVLLLACLYACSAVYSCAVGIASSTYHQSTAAAAAVSYICIFASLGLFFLCWFFRWELRVRTESLLWFVCAALLMMTACIIFMSMRKLLPTGKGRQRKTIRPMEEAGGQMPEMREGKDN